MWDCQCTCVSCELLSERVAQVARGPGSTQGIGLACGTQPTKQHMPKGEERERTSEGQSEPESERWWICAFLTSTWGPQVSALHHMLSACLSTFLSASMSVCHRLYVLSAVKLMGTCWDGTHAVWTHEHSSSLCHYHTHQLCKQSCELGSYTYMLWWIAVWLDRTSLLPICVLVNTQTQVLNCVAERSMCVWIPVCAWMWWCINMFYEFIWNI